MSEKSRTFAQGCLVNKESNKEIYSIYSYIYKYIL
jgi:hypothetical protein